MQKLITDSTQLFKLGISRNTSSRNESSTIFHILGGSKPGGGGGNPMYEKENDKRFVVLTRCVRGIYLDTELSMAEGEI